ncbi:hypothetical protein SAMD00019534_036600, partial [Acytostelium subglobosum LB1]|uniref:hypothetical protein n=1 Tax=Acytostelium subglobosum LB1 TaxID=1410327 RepID=UPI000644DDC0
GRLVTWFVCGPSIKTPPHMGHARSYVCFDIQRRIMMDYFGYDVQYIMSMNDIDHQILLQANRLRLHHGKLDPSKSSVVAEASTDFIMWNHSKTDCELAWPSPWGPGQPSWHVQCSAMASDILGSNIDIHSGCEDFTFPHHNNVIAQCEAHHECNQWANYSIHTGHLTFSGQRMHMEIKNYITIKSALEKFTARQ